MEKKGEKTRGPESVPYNTEEIMFSLPSAPSSEPVHTKKVFVEKFGSSVPLKIYFCLSCLCLLEM